MGTFQQIVEFITNFGYNIRYRELCWIISGFNSKGLGNNFYQSVALNPIHKWIFFGEKVLSSWVPVKVEVLFMCLHQPHFGLLQGPQPPVVVPFPGSSYATTLSLHRCFVTCYTHSSGDFNRKNFHQQGIYNI